MKRHTVMMVENCIAMGLGFDVSDVIICFVSFFFLCWCSFDPAMSKLENESDGIWFDCLNSL